ncbi:thiosulfate oxidation carrier protein SoxY [Pandoraea pnomenusa]|jgi:sulfur-oxidizing protein SoxY|uniref:Tat pathway signal protein n=2 Tax=Pandoraea TaxID=93217 RepID=A0ABY6WSM1_9BURK|nr:MULTISPECIES: thiosulfate oxidation carrier protein SoxY [Pandoraea]AHB08123.1 Tat pathway signal protein [Pandoraea pnomenusa 3kgm]AHB75686.1 thiosulfate oxidation carrier protein SoxY [Pandoraea pnomenusa]AHN75999.1 thiosulfate oxidation carrier protein SoxY [Pandoraea pnomenusa]MBN9093550.1 thiosulfate oxidation carrier protein SoxY [Pandoraea pnomenusa]QDH61816.1 thiosulfate oxidation carrier protein SoxY [Pandoraea pnomenusa]
MNQQRRDMLRFSAVMGLAVAAGLIKPEEARAAQEWNKAAFATRSVADTVKALGGTSASPSDQVVLSVPDIAENGAVVPVVVASKAPNTQMIAILIEKNPNTLAASFDIPEGTEPSVTTRVKMGQTSKVYALVKADNKYLVAEKEVKVTLGGCGG